MLDATPAWTVFDSIVKVARIEIHDGRQTNLDQTEAGGGTVFIHDTTGLLDPNNVASPYFGALAGHPIAIAVWNPVTSVWVQQARWKIERIGYVIVPVLGADGKPIVANIQIECVGIFAYLANAEMQVGVAGSVPVPSGSSAGTVVYAAAEVDDRIIGLLADAGVPSALYRVFSGNVNVLQSAYDPGDAYLMALREAVDAEQPALGNQYEDREGRYVFHGRESRLDPDTVAAGAGAAWTFTRWKAGDGTAVAADSANAQIREFAYGVPLDRVVNSAIAYPEDIPEADIPGQLQEDAASQTALGIYSWSKTGLIVASHKTNGDTGAEQCVKYGDFMISYYSVPMVWVERIGFKSVHPTDARATTTWAFMLGVSISDIVRVSVGYPSGTGVVATDYYVEGRDMTITPLAPTYDLVDLSLNLSPAIEDTLGIFA